MPAHLQLVTSDEDVAVRCDVCGTTCPVPPDLDVNRVMALLLERHPADPHQGGGCPDWEG